MTGSRLQYVKRAVVWLDGNKGNIVVTSPIVFAVWTMGAMIVSAIHGDRPVNPLSLTYYGVALAVAVSVVLVALPIRWVWFTLLEWAECPPVTTTKAVAAPDPFEEIARREVEELAPTDPDLRSERSR